MNNSNLVTEQRIGQTRVGGSSYVALDGMVKYCITAPLLELPVDFKEWYQPSRCHTTQH